jgi:hypothetical protein
VEQLSALHSQYFRAFPNQKIYKIFLINSVTVLMKEESFIHIMSLKNDVRNEKVIFEMTASFLLLVLLIFL